MRVLDERTIAFPVYDGNGMYLTAGNALVNPQVGLLFIDFEGRKRLRLNGVASVREDDPLLAEYPEAQLVVRVEATEVFPNCPRYIHEYRLVRALALRPAGGVPDAGARVEDARVGRATCSRRPTPRTIRTPRSSNGEVARVFASRRFPDRVRAELERSFELDLHDSMWPLERDELLRRVAGKDGLMLMLTDRVDDELLDAAGPQLRVVADYSVGVDNVDLEACRRRGVVVSNTPGRAHASDRGADDRAHPLAPPAGDRGRPPDPARRGAGSGRRT